MWHFIFHVPTFYICQWFYFLLEHFFLLLPLARCLCKWHFLFCPRINFQICNRVINNRWSVFHRKFHLKFESMCRAHTNAFVRIYIATLLHDKFHITSGTITIMNIQFKWNAKRSYLIYANEMWPFRKQLTLINLWFKRWFIATTTDKCFEAH